MAPPFTIVTLDPFVCFGFSVGFVNGAGRHVASTSLTGDHHVFIEGPCDVFSKSSDMHLAKNAGWRLVDQCKGILKKM